MTFICMVGKWWQYPKVKTTVTPHIGLYMRPRKRTEGAWECTVLSTSGVCFGQYKVSMTPTTIVEVDFLWVLALGNCVYVHLDGTRSLLFQDLVRFELSNFLKSTSILRWSLFESNAWHVSWEIVGLSMVLRMEHNKTNGHTTLKLTKHPSLIIFENPLGFSLHWLVKFHCLWHSSPSPYHNHIRKLVKYLM